MRLIAAALVLACASAIPQYTSYKRRVQELAEQLVAKEAASPGEDDPTLVWFTSPLDHFDRQITDTFQQRSFVNSTFFDGSGPVFLCVGGEGPALDATVLTTSVHCADMVELAPKVGALMVAVEHRYYGSSIPVSGHRGTENLRWLSSQQALGDLANFHQQLTTNYSLTDANKWVSFGGSYPGMMSGFFRLKFPNLVHASVSSSSPWQAQLDMPEYQNIVGESLAITSVGGSDTCKATVVNGHAAIGELITTAEGRASLVQTFNFCSEDALATQATAGEWAGSGVIEVPSQENDPACQSMWGESPGCDIGSICEIMAATEGDDIAKLAAASAAQHDGKCIGGWTEGHIAKAEAALKDAAARLGTVQGSDALSWPYQTCTEFGFYQTCEIGSDCPFVQGYNNLSSSLAMCESLFGIDADTVAAQIDASNAYYGGNKPAGSRILFPNGNVDPWHGLGVLEAPRESEPVMMIDGASHHFWTHIKDEITQPQVQQAKEDIQKQVVAWLAESD